jgi:heptosyltransferase-3
LQVDRIHVLSRLFLTRPWGFFSLFARLRRERYDVALEGGMGSFSGALYAYLAGARYRIGCGGNASPFLNVRLSPEPSLHAYDGPAAYARALGVSCPDTPLYVVSDAERDAALRTLRAAALAPNGVPSGFVVLCVGGHYDKRWPTERWIELVRHLSSAGVRMVVSVGPEDKWLAPRLEKAAAPGGRVIAPESVRVFAALCMHARMLITPDSGPMHLGAALGVPTLALLQTEASLSYCPRGEEDRTLVRPSAAQVVETLRALSVWGEIRVTT